MVGAPNRRSEVPSVQLNVLIVLYTNDTDSTKPLPEELYQENAYMNHGSLTLQVNFSDH